VRRERLFVAALAVLAIALGVALFQSGKPEVPSHEPETTVGENQPTRAQGSADTTPSRVLQPRSADPETDPSSQESRAVAEGSLRLQVLDDSKSAVSQALLAVFRGNVVLGGGWTTEQGITVLDGSEGAATAVAFPSDACPSVHALRDARGRVTLTLPAGEAVAGRVVVDGHLPKRPVELLLYHDAGVVSLKALPWPESVDAWVQRQLVARRRLSREPLRASTDESGAFRFSGLPRDWKGSLAIEWGYLHEEPGGGMITLDAPRRGLELRFRALPRIVGRVVTHGDRQPVANAIVEARLHEKTGGWSSGNRRTDSRGTFSVVVPAEGAFVGAQLTVTNDSKAGQRTLDLEGDFAEDRDVGDIELTEILTCDVMVVTAAGLPVAKAAVTADPISNGPGYVMPDEVVRTDSEGRARIQLNRGASEIRVVAPGYAAARVEAPVRSGPMRIVLQKATRLLVEARLKGGGDAPTGTVIEIESQGHLIGTPGGYVDPHEIAVGASEPEWGSRIGPTGGVLIYKTERVTVGGIRPGISFIVRARDTLGGAVAEETMTMNAGEWKAVTLALGEKTRRFHGRVLTEAGDPVAGAWVHIGEGQAGQRQLWHRGTRRDGSFDFGQVALNEVLLTVGSSWSELVKIPENGEEVIIRLPAPRNLSVTILDSFGNAVAGARVSPWHSKTGQEVHGAVSTGADGKVSLNGMPSKDLRIVTEVGVTSLETVLREVPEQVTIGLAPSGTVSVSWRFKLPDNPGDLRLERLDRVAPPLREQIDYAPFREDYTCLIRGVPPGRYRVHLDRWDNDFEKEVAWVIGPEVEVAAGERVAVTLTR
jgi:hypothetical protein